MSKIKQVIIAIVLLLVGGGGSYVAYDNFQAGGAIKTRCSNNYI